MQEKGAKMISGRGRISAVVEACNANRSSLPDKRDSFKSGGIQKSVSIRHSLNARPVKRDDV
jgi:hypothetical protein